MWHDWVLQLLAGVATAGLVAIAQRCFAAVRHLKRLVGHIAGMQTTVTRLEGTVASLQSLPATVEALDEAVFGLWSAVRASRPEVHPPVRRERPRG